MHAGGGRPAKVSKPWLLALTAYGILNGVLYGSLLPLWEGFDEPFHYAYVQALSTGKSLPRSPPDSLR